MTRDGEEILETVAGMIAEALASLVPVNGAGMRVEGEPPFVVLRPAPMPEEVAGEAGALGGNNNGFYAT